MKTGDRVVLKEFNSNSIDLFTPMMGRCIGAQVVVKAVNNSDGTFSIGSESGEDVYWLQSACEPVQGNRYFMISYRANTGGIGNCFAIRYGGKFPKESEIESAVKKDHNIDITITNIFEFKSEQDFLDFTSNE